MGRTHLDDEMRTFLPVADHLELSFGFVSNYPVIRKGNRKEQADWQKGKATLETKS